MAYRPLFYVISPNFVDFGTDYVKVIDDTPVLSGQKCSPKNLVFSDISFMAKFAEVTDECIIERHLHEIDRLHNSLTSDQPSSVSFV